jgi:YD repeat-containing protein
LGLVCNATDGPGGYSKMLSDNIFIPLRTDARLSTAFVTTYEHNLLVGQVSSTDLNSRTTYYGYDLFGRLSSVKDHNQHFMRKYDYMYWK